MSTFHLNSCNMLPFSSFSEETSDVMCLEGGWLICRSVCRLPPPTPPQSHVRNPTEETGGFSYWQTDPSILRVLSYFEQMSDKGSAYSWTEKLFWRDIQYFCNWRALAKISSVPKKKWPLYCPQGSGTLRQQLLMMHSIAWYCMVLHCIA